MSILLKVKDLFSKHLRACLYVIFGGVSLIVFASLLVWAFLGGDTLGITILNATVNSVEGTKNEYLLGEKFNADGLSLNIGSEQNPEIIDISKCSVSADFSSAGNKRVAVSYQADSSTIYTGYFDVRVYFVRRISIVSNPQSILVGEDGTFTTDESFVIHAELDSLPNNTNVYERVEGKQNTVVLSSEMYQTSAQQKGVEGYYEAGIFCGNISYDFNFYNNADKTFMVQSEKSIVSYTNDDQTATDTLVLVVTDTAESYKHDCVGSSKGHYIYTDENGVDTITDFNYQLTETQEIFKSTVQNGLTAENKTASGYFVTFNGSNFTATPTLWQSAVVNGSIYKDGDYNFVVDSEARILDFTNQNAQGKETLTLYVSNFYFDMSAGSGYSEGFYIFTDANGVKYKHQFYMQSWYWDHVPLSGTKGDMRQDTQVGDYLLAQYNGDIVAEFSIYSRTEGWVKYSFTAGNGELRSAAYAMK